VQCLTFRSSLSFTFIILIANNDLSGRIPEELGPLLEGLTVCFLGMSLCDFAHLLGNGWSKLTQKRFDPFHVSIS
jgi:hypothetical protein